MVPRLTGEELRELSLAPVLCSWQLVIHVTADKLFVGAIRQVDGEPRPRTLWYRSWQLPPEIGEPELLHAGLTAFRRAANDGRLALT